MSGVSGVTELYAETGEPVGVELIDGRYQVLVCDDDVERTLEIISLELARIDELLTLGVPV